MARTLNLKAGEQSASSGFPARPSPLNRRSLWVLIFAAAVVWSMAQAGLFGRDTVNQGGWPLVLRFLQAGLHPDLSPAFLLLVVKATLVTLAYAVCGAALSTLLGFVGGIFASEVWWQAIMPPKTEGRLAGYRLPWLALRGGLALPRAIHEIIWGLFFVNILGLTPLTAILAIAIPFGAITAKVFSEILDETPRRPLNILLNSGASPMKALVYGLLPPAFPNLLSYAFYRFECSIRAAAVLGIIGAGGLGYEIFLSLQSLRYEQMWTLFLALFLLSGLTDFWSALLRRRLGVASRLELNLRKLGRPEIPLLRRDPVVSGSLVAAAGLLVFSFWYLRPNFAQLLAPRTARLLGEVMRQSFPPAFEAGQMGQLAALSTQTLAMSILAMAGAGLLGLLFSFPAANNFLLPDGVLEAGSPNTWRRIWGTAALLFSRGLLLVFRAIPAPIWALLLLFVFFPGILPGAMALGLYTLGILGRLMAEVVENLDARPSRALKVQGAAGPQVFLYGVLPRTLPGFVAYLLYRWEVCIRATVIVGLVGAGGLGRLLTEQLSSFDYPGVVTTLIFFLTLTWLVDIVSALVRRELR